MRGLDAHLLEVLILHHNIPTALVFKAFYNLIGGNLLRVRFRHFFLFDRTEVAGTKLPETKLLLSRGGINGHGNVDQPKADAAFPDGAHNTAMLSHSVPPVNLKTAPPGALCFAEIPCNSGKESDVGSGNEPPRQLHELGRAGLDRHPADRLGSIRSQEIARARPRNG